MTKRWRVLSGDLDCTQTAETPQEAFIAAVKRKSPQTLGHIFEARVLGQGRSEVVNGEDRIWYGSVERAMRKAGLLTVNES